MSVFPKDSAEIASVTASKPGACAMNLLAELSTGRADDPVTGRVVIVNPYARNTGGGAAVQEAFMATMASARQWSACDRLDVAGHLLTISVMRRLWQARRSLRGAALIVFQGFYSPTNIPLTLFARRAGIPYIIVPRGDYVPAHWRMSGVRNAFSKRLLWQFVIRHRMRNAAAVVASSKLELDRLLRAGARPVFTAVVPDPFSPPWRRRVGSTTRRIAPFALYLGRLAIEKNLEFVVRLWPQVRAAVPDAKLKLVGPAHHPEVRARLEHMVAQLGLALHIEFIPWVEADAKAELIEDARCVILPSSFESLGLTVLEAVYHRTRFIASDQTPWHGAPASAGDLLPLDAHAWTIQLIRLLGAAQKAAVPDDVAKAMLQPYSLESVQNRWSEVLRSIGFLSALPSNSCKD